MLKGMRNLQLHWQILIALILALFAGLLAGEEGGIFGITFYSIFNFVGTLFLNALMILVVPLIVFSIIIGLVLVNSTTSAACIPPTRGAPLRAVVSSPWHH